MQNREAQRRFRERKEEHLTTLEKRAAIAEERYKKLLKDTEQQTTETVKLRTDNKRLKAETQRLRERWRTMLALLQPAQRLIALSVLLAGNTQDDELEDFMRSLKG
jgi:fructoselysine-6-P-deglycase FrlB-like protein